MSINWNNIRPLESSQNEGFEELVCQLARKEEIPDKNKFIRKGKPDAGVECYWILKNDDEWAWQAKFFISSLDDSQWKQLDKSVKTVIAKHPNLKKYYVAIPNDPPDARIDGQTSMLDKWNARVKKWEGLATAKGLNVEFIPWWSSDLIGRLQKPENAGLTYFWFNKEEFTDKWGKEQTELSIVDLGKRYTPKLNVELDIVKIFDGISRNEKFKKQVENLFDQLLVKGNKIIPRIDDLKSESTAVQEQLNSIRDLFQSVDFQGISTIPIDEFLKILNELSQSTDRISGYYFDEENKLKTKHDDSRYYKKYGAEISYIREFDSSIYQLKSFFKETSIKLANHPFLLLEGEAGIGKSHLLADIVHNRNFNNVSSLFFLGQHFVADEDPWTQIFKKNDIKCSVDEFLGAMNSKAQISGNRIIIFIDAVNEGRGKYFWDKNIKSFLAKIKNYEWLGLALSVRSSYSELIFPKDEIGESEIIRHTHYGFMSHEYEATKLFFHNYNIELPSIPLLHPEFQNPLFLILFCEGLNKAGYTKIPDGLQGISSIISFFIDSINSILSKPDRLEYPVSINVVRKAIDSIISYKIKGNLRIVHFEKAFTLVNKISTDFNIKRGLLDELISEGILSKNLFLTKDGQYEEGVYLAYERFEDHLIASLLIDENPDLEKAFKIGGNLHYLIKDENECYRNKGVIEALTIQVPEKTGTELHELVPHVKDSYPIVQSFVQSLLWRKTETTSERLLDYVNTAVLSFQETQDLFWDTVLSVTSIPNHYFNAYFLHKNLIRYSLADRDEWWTKYLKDQFDEESAVKRLVDWSWNTNDKSHVSDESIKLTAITLAWLHTSTNRKLRDSATKALVCLLENRIHVLIELLKKFEDVNDPYIYERLFAVAYGGTVRTEQRELLPGLSEYIFETIFNKKGEIYPHILLRDYARGVIEYTHFLGHKLSFDISKARPPYQSDWPQNIQTLEELKGKYKNDEYHHLRSSVLGFGDFARYIIGTNSNMSTWSGFQKNESPIDRDAVFEDFKSNLSPEQLTLLNNLDPIITEEGGKDVKIGDTSIKIKIAVGRKSENELNIAKSNFKKSIDKEILRDYENDIEPYLDHSHKIINTGKHFDLRIAQRFIFSRVIGLGWKPEFHLSFDKMIGTGRVRDTYPHERISKKYQWIAYYEYMAKLSDNFIKYAEWNYGNKEVENFEGPWNPYVRDIDPTMIIKDIGHFNEEEPAYFWWSKKTYMNWELGNKTWLKTFDDLPCFKKMLNIIDENDEDWLVLEGYPEWAESKKIGDERWDKPHKRMWCHLRSYLVPENEYTTMKEWALTQDFMGRWMPKSSSRYEVFSREYYWSPAYNYFNKEYYNGIELREVKDQKTGKYISKVMLTADDFLWEEEFDKSKDDTISFLKPSKHIYENMKMIYSKQEGEFTDENGSVICFAPSVYNDSKSYLLIKKKPFLKYLEKNNLKIIWAVLGEKNIIGGHSSSDEYLGRLEISGVFYLTDEQAVDGIIHSKVT